MYYLGDESVYLHGNKLVSNCHRYSLTSILIHRNQLIMYKQHTDHEMSVTLSSVNLWKSNKMYFGNYFGHEALL